MLRWAYRCWYLFAIYTTIILYKALEVILLEHSEFFFLNFVRKLNAKFHNSHTTLHSCQCENVPAASTFSLTCVFKKNIIINILIDVKWCSTVVCFHFLYDLGCLAWFSCTHWPLISISSEKRSFAPLAYFNRVF